MARRVASDIGPRVLNPIPVVAARTGLGKSTINTEIRRGRLRSVKVGARRLVPESALLDYVAMLEREAGEPRGRTVAQ